MATGCQQCTRLLKMALADRESSAVKLLNSLGSQGDMKHDENGVTVSVAPQTSKLLRRWTQLQSSSEGERVLLPTQLATSATTTEMVSTNSNKQQQQQQQEKQLDSLRIECRPCSSEGPEGGARAFVMGPDPLSVVLCSNRVSSRDEVEEVLVHELVHVYDVRVQRLDLRLCENLAYSEIRAATQAECANAWLAPSMCIRNNAVAATSNLFPTAQAKTCVQRVFPHASRDTAPFATTANTTTTTTTTTTTRRRRRQPLQRHWSGLKHSEK